MDAHRPYGPYGRLKGYDLKAILSHQEPRVVTNDYTVQYQRQKWQILKQSHGGGLRRSKVVVEPFGTVGRSGRSVSIYEGEYKVVLYRRGSLKRRYATRVRIEAGRTTVLRRIWR